MTIIIDDVLNEPFKDYLIMQDGIENVGVMVNDFTSKVNIECDKKISPQTIMNYIFLFYNNQIPFMLEFDKNINGNHKVLKYVVDDMCCEYCYKGFVQDLFENEYIISVKSNFDFHKPAFDIEFFIEYNDNYDENMLTQYIQEKLD